MSLLDHYDWIVLGDHPAALFLACQMARFGRAVLIIPEASKQRTFLNAVWTQAPRYFDPEPNDLYGLIDSAQNPELAFMLPHFRSLQPGSLFFNRIRKAASQVLTRSCRIAIGLDISIEMELQREWGFALCNDLGLLGALRDSEAHFIKNWHKAKTPLAKRLQVDFPTKGPRQGALFKNKYDPRCVEVFEALAASLLGVPQAEPGPLEVLAYLHLAQMRCAFLGGIGQYRESLIAIAQGLGAHLHRQARIQRIFVQKNRFSAVMIEGNAAIISAQEGAILGMPIRAISGGLTATGPEAKREPLPELTQSLDSWTTGWRLTLALRVKKEAFSPALQSRAVWYERGAPALEIELMDEEDDRLEDRNLRVLHLRVVLPFREDTLRPKFLRLIASRILNQAYELFPFLADHVLSVFPEFRAGAAEQESELVRLYGFPTLQDIPDILLVYGGQGLKAKNQNKMIDRLWITSDESHPTLGKLGAHLASLEVLTKFEFRL